MAPETRSTLRASQRDEIIIVGGFRVEWSRVARSMVLLLGLVGCDTVFQLQDPTGDARTGDAPDGDAPPACQPQTIFDDFDDTTVCGNWGFEGGLNRVMTQGNGQLVIEPNLGGGNGSCSTPSIAFVPSGLFVEVSEVLPPMISYMFLQLKWSSTEAILTYDQGQLVFKVNDVVIGSPRPHDPTTTRWWRIRPNGAAITADVSPDGKDWDPIGTHSIAVPAAVNLDIQAGQFAPSAVQHRAVFERFNVCPD